MQNVLFVDLDDTLFQSLRKCTETTSASRDHLIPRAFLADGSPVSYATPKQQMMWSWLSGLHRVIPVTARNSDAFNRVDLSFTDYVILNHGAVILEPNGDLNEEWHQRTLQGIQLCQADLRDLWEKIELFASSRPNLNPRLVSDFGVEWYALIKHKAADVAVLEALRSVISCHPGVTSGRLYCHMNDNNLVVMPNAVRKEAAVRFLLEKTARPGVQRFSIAMGDSLTDLPFMALCDYSIIPSKTQLGAYLCERS